MIASPNFIIGKFVEQMTMILNDIIIGISFFNRNEIRFEISMMMFTIAIIQVRYITLIIEKEYSVAAAKIETS